jgi:hypothetical protein
MGNVLLGLFMAILILVLGNFVFHIAEGSGRFLLFIGAVLVFCACAFSANILRKQ